MVDSCKLDGVMIWLGIRQLCISDSTPPHSNRCEHVQLVFDCSCWCPFSQGQHSLIIWSHHKHCSRLFKMRAKSLCKIGCARSCTLTTKPAAGINEMVLQVSQQLPTNVWSGIKYVKVTRSCCPAFQGPSLKMQEATDRPRRSHVLLRYKGERQVHKMSKTISVCVYYANPLSNLWMHVCTKGPSRERFF